MTDIDGDLARLKAFASRDAATERVFNFIGFLVMEPDQFDTWVGCPPPPEGIPFVSTGGESEYYLQPDGKVVLYVPIDDGVVVAGSDLREFLAIICQIGPVLDGFAYDWEREVGEYEEEEEGWRAELDDWPDMREVVDALAAEFNVEPHPDPVRRLAELNGRT